MVHNKKHTKTKGGIFYKMKGCSKKTHKNYLGGKIIDADLNFAYPYTGSSVSNPSLAYTGKGGTACSNGITPSNLAYPQNINGNNPNYPSTGPPSGGFNLLNPLQIQRGGGSCQSCNLQTGGTSHRSGCKCSMCKMKGGGCGCALQKGGKYHHVNCKCKTCKMNGGGCGCALQKGGKYHDVNCKCKTCKMNGGNCGCALQKGGTCSTSNNGIPYPDGLVGSDYNNPMNLPGVNHISGDANYYANNLYKSVDPQTSMQNIGANPPFLGVPTVGGKRTRKNKHLHRGGTLSNFLGQDFLNLGRQLGYGVGSAYNAISGYSAAVNPLPWKGQLPNTASLSAIKSI
jgi:hypothetical protein